MAVSAARRHRLLLPVPVALVVLVTIGVSLPLWESPGTQQLTNELSTRSPGPRILPTPGSTSSKALAPPGTSGDTAKTLFPPQELPTRPHKEDATVWAQVHEQWLRVNAIDRTGEATHASSSFLKLTPDALAAVRSVKRAPHCPQRYIFVNTHTFGRHHNQLQEMLNLAIWGRTFNRTAVIGWFRHNHKWTAMQELYDFHALQEQYCVITVNEFASQFGSLTEKSAVCVGQKLKGNPIRNIVRHCGLVPGVPAHYDSRFGVSSTKTFLTQIISNEDARRATFLSLSGEIAFFIRPGLLEQVAASRLVVPATHITNEAKRFATAANLRLAVESGPDATNMRPYFALHLRQREAECMKEMKQSWLDGAAHLEDIAAFARTEIEAQCAVSVEQFNKILTSAVLRLPIPDGPALFLASDHQNKVLEAALVARGARLYEGGKFHTQELGGLEGLGVDYFLLLQGDGFTGNQLSSISQNACFYRLGHGLLCDGFVPAFTLFHSRCVDAAVFVPNVPWRA
jgi:hypothetical protein